MSTAPFHRNSWRVVLVDGSLPQTDWARAGPPTLAGAIAKRVGKGNPPVEGDELPPEFAAKKKRSR